MRSVSSPRAVSISTGTLECDAQPAQHLEAVEVRQHHVEHHDVEAAGRQRAQAGRTVAALLDLEAARAQVGAEHVGQPVVVVDDQDARRDHRLQSRRDCRASIQWSKRASLSATCLRCAGVSTWASSYTLSSPMVEARVASSLSCARAVASFCGSSCSANKACLSC